MAGEVKIGTNWQDDELDAIVADYFAMLEADISGKRYVKSRYSEALMARIGRTHRSVEFKHQNISAVLDELGMPWIRGYKPKRNYQNAIFDAIDRYLTRHPSLLETVAAPPAQAAAPGDIFVASPPLTEQRIPIRLQRLVRTFDPVERDHRNRLLGRAGEEFVIDIERRRLAAVDRTDLARKIQWISAVAGDGAGYDVLSFEPSGRERLLEVKTTNGSARTPFFLTRHERDIAKERQEHWCIYRVHLFSTEPRIFTIAPPLEKAVNLPRDVAGLVCHGGPDGVVEYA
jgi:hypothetical protein